MDQNNANTSYRQSFGPIRSPLRTNHPNFNGANLSSVQRGSVRGHQQSMDLSSAHRPPRVFSAGGNNDDEEEEYERRRQQAINMRGNASNGSGAAGNRVLQPSLRPHSSNMQSSQVGNNSQREPLPQLRPIHHLGSMPHHIKEHIQHLQQDNAGLLRRLNAVHQELERLNREKGDLQSQYTHFMQQATEAYDLLQRDDNVDKVNMYMKDDLHYEKERNGKVRMQIDDLNHQIVSLQDELKRLEDEQEFMIRQNQETSYVLQKTLTDLGDLEKEQYFNQERLKDSALNIDQVAIECQHDDQDKLALRGELEFLMIQRAEIIERTNQISRDFEITIAQITEERKIMEINNSSHAKAITAKLLFNSLQEIYNNKLLFGFQEIHQYTKFDNKCNQKLKFVANLLEKAGNAKLRIVLSHWFSAALKPIEVIQQKMHIAEQSDRLTCVSHFYRLWRDAFKQKIDSYDKKTQAIQLIWNKMSNDTTIEKKRSFRIWKETFAKFRIQKFRLRRILWKKFFKQAGIAFNSWQNHSTYFDSQVRLHILAQSYSYQQQMAILFRQFHLQTQNSKRKRQSTLAHCLKGWRDYLNHQKYLMSQTILASHFKVETNTSLVQAIFDALKQHKQKKLYFKTEELLSNECNNIHQLTIQNCQILENRHHLNQFRALTTVATCQRKKLWSYLGHWRQLNINYHDQVRTTLSDKVIKLYMSWLRVAFSRWKLRDAQETTKSNKNRISDLQGQNRETQNEIIDLTNSNTATQDERGQMRQRHLMKCVNAYEKRRVQISVGRWRDQVVSMNTKENGARIIVRRLRLRYCRKAFDLYKDGLKFKRTNSQQENRCALYNKLRNDRLLNLVLNSWIIFKNQHQEAKKSWYCIFLKLEVSLKRLSIKKWRESTQIKAENSLEDHSTQLCDTIQNLNHSIGELQHQEERQQVEVSSQNKLLTTQGQRILATAFARFYHINQTRGFEKWKEFMVFTKLRESLLDKAASHSKKSQFYVVKSAFQNWIQYTNISDRQSEIKKELQRIEDLHFQQDLQTQKFNNDSQELAIAIDGEQNEYQLISKKHQNTIQLIVSRVNQNHYMARKRFIFQQWSEHVKREVYFINCIKNVLQKSLWNTGFQAIREAARQDTQQNLKEVVLTNFFQMFKNKVLINSLSKWRGKNYHNCRDDIHRTLVETQTKEEKHQERVEKIKGHNAQRAYRLLTEFHMKNVIQAWRNGAAYLKIERAKTELFRAECNSADQRNALLKWRSRNKKTKEVREQVRRIRAEVRKSTLFQCYAAIKKNYFDTKELIMRLSNLARVVDNQFIQTSFAAIRSFAKAKQFAHAKRKENASIWLGETLSDLVKRKKQQYLTEFKLRCQNKRNQEFFQRLVGNLTHANKMRDFFHRWRENSTKVMLAKDLYETGPVREQDYLYKSELRNIKDLMKNEGYDEEDTGKALIQHDQHKRYLMVKAIKRLQHFNSELYSKPKMFDIWKRYVQVKRQYRYWLQFVEKRAKILKSDLHYVFDKWKRFHPVRQNVLTCLPKAVLGKRAVVNNKALDQLAESIHEKESTVDHLNAQRDTLLDNYIKAQRLALALCQAQQRHSLHQAFSQWSDEQKRRKNMDFSMLLRNNLQHLEALKDRVKQLEADNDIYAAENEELRQFTIDGYDIAKNVQVLSSEREILSVDLADKAQVIRKLLDENEALTRKLEKAQDHAQSLIRTTMRVREGPAGNTGLYSSGITRR